MDGPDLFSSLEAPSSPWSDEPVGGWAQRLGVPRLEIHDLLPSTNDRLRSLAADGAPLFTTVVARSQSEGRGRGGKRWHSAPDCGLWISTLLPMSASKTGSGIGVLPLAVGVAAARAVEEVARVSVELKWPNDLLLSGAKFAGILCELTASLGSAREQAVVAGIGIDLRCPPGELPGEMREGVSFLDEVAGACIPEPRLAATLLAELRRWTDPAPQLLAGELLHEWEMRDALVGRLVQIVGGGERIGTVRGVAPGGALLLEGAGREIEEVWSGTVRPVSSAS